MPTPIDTSIEQYLPQLTPLLELGEERKLLHIERTHHGAMDGSFSVLQKFIAANFVYAEPKNWSPRSCTVSAIVYGSR